MPFTAQLGTADSMPGNIALAYVVHPIPRNARATVTVRTRKRAEVSTSG